MTNINPIEALSDPTRRKLFERLRSGACSVGELVKAVPVSQPAVSQHLRVLKDARLVRVQKQGQQRIYSLDPQGLAELRAYIDSFWDRVLEAFQSAAENSADIKPAKEDLRNE
jgi:DNA-binding transcriptional ArsR family regulator